MNNNIFVACDVSSQKEILELLSKIHNEISGIKIGLQYITKHSPEEIKELSKFKKPIFNLEVFVFLIISFIFEIFVLSHAINTLFFII